MSNVVYKSNGGAVADGDRICRVSNGGGKMEFYIPGSRTYSEVILKADVITPPPIDPVDPIDPPPPPPPPIDPPPPPPPPTAPANAGNVAALTAALAAATGGEVITLAPGNYGNVTLSGKAYASKVTVKSDGGALFGRISITGGKNLCFDGITLDWFPTAATLDHHAGFTATNTEGLTLANCVFTGHPHPTTNEQVGRGISVQPGKNLTLTGNDVSGFRRGILTSDVDGMRIAFNHVHDNRTSILSGGGVSNVLIEGNHLETSRPVNFGGAGDHGDVIHYWTPTGQTAVNRNFVIRNNFMEQGDGTALLGIYLDNNNELHGFADVLIENNVLHNGSGQGIRLEDVAGGVVRNNTLLQSKGDYHDAPRIRVEAGCRDIVLRDNIVSNSTTGAAMPNAASLNIVESGTVQLPHLTAVAAQAGKFVGLPKDNGTLADMQQVPGAFPAGVGALLTDDMIYPARRA